MDEGGEEANKKKSSVEQSFRRGTIVTLGRAKEETRDVADRLLKVRRHVFGISIRKMLSFESPAISSFAPVSNVRDTPLFATHFARRSS